jgi:hypothetical protein
LKRLDGGSADRERVSELKGDRSSR